MTWKEFKDAVENAGCKDDDPVFFIEIYDTKAPIRAQKLDVGWEIS